MSHIKREIYFMKANILYKYLRKVITRTDFISIQ